MNPETDIFKLFDQNWGLLAAGTADCHNAMTISWGRPGNALEQTGCHSICEAMPAHVRISE